MHFAPSASGLLDLAADMRLCFLRSVSRLLRVREFALVPGPPASLDTDSRLERRDTEGAGLARAGRYVWLGSRWENFRHLKVILQNDT